MCPRRKEGRRRSTTSIGTKTLDSFCENDSAKANGCHDSDRIHPIPNGAQDLDAGTTQEQEKKGRASSTASVCGRGLTNAEELRNDSK